MIEILHLILNLLLKAFLVLATIYIAAVVSRIAVPEPIFLSDLFKRPKSGSSK